MPVAVDPVRARHDVVVRRWRVAAVVALLLLPLLLPSSRAVVGAGPVLEVGALAFPTVRSRDATVGEAWLAARLGRDLRDARPADVRAASRDRALAAARAADRAAVRLLAARGLPAAQVPPVVAARHGGPSGGLATALAHVDAADGTVGDLVPAGLRVAATGAIGADGLAPVGGLRHKLVGLVREGYDLLLVEAVTWERAVGLHAGVPVAVAPVTSLDGAVDLLCAAGGTDAVCG